MVMFSKGVPFFKQAALTWEPHPCFPFQHHLIQLAVVPGGFIATLICEFPLEGCLRGGGVGHFGSVRTPGRSIVSGIIILGPPQLGALFPTPFLVGRVPLLK